MSHRITRECIGCGVCRRVCPVSAIAGSHRKLHLIDPVLCIDCGSCGRFCPEAAVRDEDGTTVHRIKKSEWVRPVISAEACFACENCVEVCPANALSMNGETPSPETNFAVLSSPDNCVSCGWCFDNCQFDAIVMEAAHAGN